MITPQKRPTPRHQDNKARRKDALSQVLESLSPSADDVALAKVLGQSQAPQIPRALDAVAGNYPSGWEISDKKSG